VCTYRHVDTTSSILDTGAALLLLYGQSVMTHSRCICIISFFDFKNVLGYREYKIETYGTSPSGMGGGRCEASGEGPERVLEGRSVTERRRLH